MLLLSLQFKVVNDDESPGDNETEDIKKLLVLHKQSDDFVVLTYMFIVETLHVKLLGEVLVEDLKDVRPVENLLFNLCTLLIIKLLQQHQDLRNDRTDFQD